MIFVAEKVPWR